ncbi:YdeI/OmpD-associated family protein [Leptolyngbya cf. ectocarpi LEGE 11479]|uniref:YdeI/OmpD-associated family protein n=1 Tax=Leptolyngbya cf. ectocarpi LEGE 11479 TaxID=1828722 RepID=A0A928ZVC7_LEPEC|nr:YdeI/OmpD-associated family protein [Leptolyngbya cf. ectocarpi LEGE 11479]
MLQWIKRAKQTATREKRIAKTVELAGQNIKANR